MTRLLSILTLLAAPAAVAVAGAGAAAASPAPSAAPTVPAMPPPPSLSIKTDDVSVELRVPEVVARRILPAGIAATVVSAPAAGSEQFVPDVYASQVEAARGLGELWVRRAAEKWDEPDRVKVYCCDPRVYAAVAEGIRSRLGDATVEKARAEECPDGFHDGKPGDDEAWVLVDVTATEKRVGPTGPFAGGDVVISSRGASDATVSARYVEKPWLASPPVLNVSGRRYVVGRSDPYKPAMSEAEAARAARRAAVDEVVAMVRPRVGQAGADERWLRRSVEEKLAAGQFEVDRFPQRYDRRVGSIWREAVLLDVSPQNLSMLAGQLSREYRAERQNWLTSTASALGVLLVVYALYRLANAFTRGYFVWSLRTAAVVIATGGLVLLLMVIG